MSKECGTKSGENWGLCSWLILGDMGQNNYQVAHMPSMAGDTM